MKIIKPSAEVMKHDTDIYSFIERVGRTCYKSEDKIAEGTAKKFVTQLVKNGHLAVCECEYLYFFFKDYNDIIGFMTRFIVPDSNSYKLLKHINISEQFLSGNIRAWIEFFENVHDISQRFDIGYEIYAWMLNLCHINFESLFPLYDDWKYEQYEDISLVSRKDFIEAVKENNTYPDLVFKNLLPHTIKFVADRGFLAEITRHRLASFAAESTRYVNYSKGKYGSEITVIEPLFYKPYSQEYLDWKNSCEQAEQAYMNLLSYKSIPQEARTVLPQSTKTEVIVTATEEEWQHIINLRYHGTTGKPHPQMLEVMEMAYPLLTEESEGRLK